VRWDALFRDLEAQLAAAEQAEHDAEVADRTRREGATLGLVDRARGGVGSRLSVRLMGAGSVDGVLLEVGADWLLVDEGAGREALLARPAVLSLAGLTAWSSAPGSGGQVFLRLGLGSALRGIARDRSGVSAWLVDGSVVAGTVERVGADFLELSTHGPGEPRRRDAVTAVRTVPFAALAMVRSGP
jgi:hypothetical protein